MHLYRQFADDVKLCKRAMLGALIGLAALVACAITYESLYGRGDRPVAGYLSGWYLVLGGPFVAAGLLSGFAIHLLRERTTKGGKPRDFDL